MLVYFAINRKCTPSTYRVFIKTTITVLIKLLIIGRKTDCYWIKSGEKNTAKSKICKSSTKLLIKHNTCVKNALQLLLLRFIKGCCISTLNNIILVANKQQNAQMVSSSLFLHLALVLAFSRVRIFCVIDMLFTVHNSMPLWNNCGGYGNSFVILQLKSMIIPASEIKVYFVYFNPGFEKIKGCFNYWYTKHSHLNWHHAN